MTLAPGARLGPYEIVDRLGAGGMGVVYRARDDRLQRDVALKVLPPGVLTDAAARSRFRKEALALAKLSHPNIAAIYDVGERDGVDYLVMELVPGQSLAARLAAGPMPLTEVLALAVQVAAALEEAHEHGVVHRDLKPANIMVTPKGMAKVLDFGLAKLRAAGPGGAGESLAESIGPVGTPLYMSPEQAFGNPVDARTDVWSLGVVLYEALAGRAPFEGAGLWALFRSVGEEAPQPLRALRPETPPAVEATVSRALSKDPDRRHPSAAELGRELSASLAELSWSGPGPSRGRGRIPWRLAVPSVLAVVLLGVSGAFFYVRSERRHWVVEQALPAIERLEAARLPLAAFRLLARAQRYRPADTAVTRVIEADTRVVSVTSSPSGATVEIQDYLTPDSGWYALGSTPLDRVRIPDGYFRWRVTRAGRPPMITAPETDSVMTFALDADSGGAAGSVRVAPGEFRDFIDFVGWVGPYGLPAYYVDRFEVTNRQYQRFVDGGGYQRPDYWTRPFRKDGISLTWPQAMALFRDRTGRPGPSTWAGGHYPPGQADYPVSGISWYEAEAYAAFTGRSLPTFAQWFRAAPPELAGYAAPMSNIGKTAVAAVGVFQGVGPFGTYDMVGNVREWVENGVAADRRLILGGAWNGQMYLSSEPEALSPFDRSAENGLRCVRNLGPLPAAATAEIEPLERDFDRVQPAPDPVYRAYRALYAVEPTPLDPRVEGVLEDTPDWRQEKVSFAAAYGNERVAAYLFLPKRVRPPFQAVLFFPSARVLYLRDSRHLGDVDFFDYVVQSGRAVLYPVYQGTYERQQRRVMPGTGEDPEITVQRAKDVARSLDYLATRPDLDTSRIAYLGVSMGAAEGVIDAQLVQDRLRAVVFLDGGFFLSRPAPGHDQVDFAPRLTRPVLMVNGRYDFSFSYERSQLPLFRMLGTPAADKRHVVLEAPHDVRTDRGRLVAAVLGWLDRYLGRVE